MTCTVCGAENPATATVCHACKAFLQNRVPTLDLFRTAWRTMTAPAQAFHEIALAEHKNYALTLFAASGIPVANLTVAWLTAGDLFGAFFETIGLVVAVGVITGAILGLLLASTHAIATLAVRGDASFRRSLGVTAYALVPTAAAGLALLPIELLTFGEHWFIGNPPPATINAASYWTVIALQSIAAVWSFGLLVIGGRVALRMPAWRSLAAAVMGVGAVAAGWLWLARTAVRVLSDVSKAAIPGI